jgi:CRP-like cAMP-binding protein
MASNNYEEFEPADRSWTDHPLFHGISATTLSTISSQTTVRRYQPGATIFRQGDVAAHLFVIRAGEVQIRRELDGQDLVIDTLGQGDIFGEMGLLTDYKRTASVVAATALEVFVLTREAFDVLISQNFAVATELVQIHNARSLAIERITAMGGMASAAPTAPSAQDQARLAATMDHQVLVVFSPAGGTGKTMLACNLGVLTARKMPRNVVLVDLSLMASQCALVLNVGGKRSLAAYIAGGGLRDVAGFDAPTWHR